MQALAVSLLPLSTEAPRLVVVAREQTKFHEEVVRGTATEVLDYFTQHKDKVRGEFVVIVSGVKK